MIEIETPALTLLLQRQRTLSRRSAGLRIVLSGDACRGWQATLQWSAEQRADDRAEELSGLRLLASQQHWPYLEGAVVSAGAQGEQTGIWVELRAAACRCDNQACAMPRTVG